MIYPSLTNLWRHRKLLREWRHEIGHRQRNVVARGRWLELVEYRIKVPIQLKGLKLLFLSDLHWEDKPGLAHEIEHFAKKANPDWVVCGGDLISYSCYIASVSALLKKLPAKHGKLCVVGNWDRKRWKWSTADQWRTVMADAGFNFLCNQGCDGGNGLNFWGTDDLRLGAPHFLPSAERPEFQTLITHNPDTVIGLDKQMDKIDLILCGHTHGGQVRLPLFGPVYTSSVYWRKFDYGMFRNERTGTRLLVTSGLGSSSIDLRLGCPRELVFIRFL